MLCECASKMIIYCYRNEPLHTHTHKLLFVEQLFIFDSNRMHFQFYGKSLAKKNMLENTNRRKSEGKHQIHFSVVQYIVTRVDVLCWYLICPMQ